MAAEGVIRAVDHPYRRNILHILARGALTYSQLFASMEPRGGGRGRFNYHLKVLREAGLIQAQENHYGLTEVGEAAVSFLEGVNANSDPRGRLKISRYHVGPLLGFSILGLASVFLLWSVLAPVANVSPVLPLDAGWGVPTALKTGERGTLSGSGFIWKDFGSVMTVGVDDMGNGLAVWSETETFYAPGVRTESKFLRAARFVPGVGWDGITSYDRPWKASSGSGPRMAVEATGSVLALWSNSPPGGALEVYASRLIPSTGWVDTTLLDQREASGGVHEIEVSPSGAAIAAWTVNHEIYAAHYSDQGWGVPEKVSPNELDFDQFGWYDVVDIEMNAEGDGVAIWTQGGELWARIFRATTGWEAPVRVGIRNAFDALDGWSTLASLVETIGGGWSSLNVGVAQHLLIDDRGEAVFVWGPCGYAGGDEPIFGSRYVRGDGWTAPHLIEPKTSAIYALETTADGHVILLWGWNYEPGPVFAHSYTPDTGWTGPEQVSTWEGGLPQLAVGPKGNAFLTWHGRVRSTSISEQQAVIWANYFVKPQSLEDLVGDVGYQLDHATARLSGLELRFLLLAGVIVALMASNGIFLSLYWYRRPGVASHAALEEERNEQPRRRS